jgi:hypothetical protein
VSLHKQEIEKYVVDHIQFTHKGKACELKPVNFMVDAHSDGEYISGDANISCNATMSHVSKSLLLNYSALFDIDPLHNSIVVVTGNSGVSTSVLSSTQRQMRIFLGKESLKELVLRSFANASTFFVSGIYHIWTGLDHILFLLVLLLPCVFIQKTQKSGQKVKGSLQIVLIDIVYIASAFTLAHSITLTAAAFDIIRLDSSLVEPLIAFSVLLCALNNLIKFAPFHGCWPAFFFGLIHGFGFASLLSVSFLPPIARLVSIISFNIGIEVGQIAIIGLFVPCAYIYRDSIWYKRLVYQGGSVIIVVIATRWMIERIFA